MIYIPISQYYDEKERIFLFLPDSYRHPEEDEYSLIEGDLNKFHKTFLNQIDTNYLNYTTEQYGKGIRVITIANENIFEYVKQLSLEETMIRFSKYTTSKFNAAYQTIINHLEVKANLP